MINVARRPDVLKKMRDEFISYASKHPASESSTKTKKEIMHEILDLEATQDLEYLNQVMQESLRI